MSSFYAIRFEPDRTTVSLISEDLVKEEERGRRGIDANKEFIAPGDEVSEVGELEEVGIFERGLDVFGEGDVHFVEDVFGVGVARVEGLPVVHERFKSEADVNESRAEVVTDSHRSVHMDMVYWAGSLSHEVVVVVEGGDRAVDVVRIFDVADPGHLKFGCGGEGEGLVDDIEVRHVVDEGEGEVVRR